MGSLFTKPLKVGPIKHKPHNEIVTMLSTGEVMISKTTSGGHSSWRTRIIYVMTYLGIERNPYSYDMKAATKEWSIAEKNIPSFLGIEPGPPG